MKLGHATAKNFGSYPVIDFDYSQLGLALLAGPTGVGKSSLLDLPAWVLYGTTSKDLNADDVKSWFAEEETSGSIRVDLPGRSLFVTRIRGKRPAQNDLFFYVERDGQPGDAEPTRGKDATDTQRMIVEELGVSADLYLAASYLHQFTGDKFFTAKAKDRRESMEKIADMALAVKLGSKASEHRKDAKRCLELKEQAAAKVQGKAETLKGALGDQESALTRWDASQDAEIARLEAASAGYEDDKQARVYKLVDQLEVLDKQITPDVDFVKRAESARKQLKAIEPLEKELRDLNNQLATAAAELKSAEKAHDKYAELNETCPTCLGPSDNPNRAAHLEEIEATMQSLLTSKETLRAECARLTDAVASKPKLQENLTKIAIAQAENRRLIDRFETIQAQAISLQEEGNPFIDQIERARAKVNPYVQEIEKTQQKLSDASAEASAVLAEKAELAKKVSGLNWLYEKSFELRGLFLARAVRTINDRTNEILEKHFDATLRVDFALVDSDKLEVTISNSGYECKYAQLSGGERCMLLLAFNFAYMRAAENKAGVKFGTLFLDEALNGFDASLKTAAFGLLQEIESDYDTVLLIDHHEEFKQLFSKSFAVSKDGAHSAIDADSI